MLTRHFLIQATIDNYTQTILMARTFVPAWINRGNCYLALDRADVAIADFEQVLKLEPNHILGHANLGRAFAMGGDGLGPTEGQRAKAKDNLKLAAQLAANQGQSGLQQQILAELKRITG
jgi:tetratricopeptide (TPR) repeat protein